MRRPSPPIWVKLAIIVASSLKYWLALATSSSASTATGLPAGFTAPALADWRLSGGVSATALPPIRATIASAIGSERFMRCVRLAMGRRDRGPVWRL